MFNKGFWLKCFQTKPSLNIKTNLGDEYNTQVEQKS